MENIQFFDVRLRIVKKSIFIIFAILLFNLPVVSAEVIDRVAAFVDDEAITLSELERDYKAAAKILPDIKKKEVLKTKINRMLLLREAKKLRIEGPNPDAIIKEYIELKLRTFIKITEDDLMEFYEQNKKEFGKTDFDSARDKIEEYLIEKEVNARLKKHIEELRTKAYIKIQLDP